MSIKPVCDCIEKADGVWFQRCECGNSGDLAEAAAWCAVQNSIPDTHRVVPVELLNRIMELAGVALVYQPFGTKDRRHFDELMAIIEDKP